MNVATFCKCQFACPVVEMALDRRSVELYSGILNSTTNFEISKYSIIAWSDLGLCAGKETRLVNSEKWEEGLGRQNAPELCKRGYERVGVVFKESLKPNRRHFLDLVETYRLRRHLSCGISLLPVGSTSHHQAIR